MVKLKEIRNMFWGVTLNGGKRYTQTIDQSFHLSMAALEAGQELQAADDKQVSVMIQYEKAEFLLCTLIHGKLFQQSLDLNFTEGEEVTFYLNGTGVVHLTGFLLEEDLENMDNNYSDSDTESEEIPELVDSAGKEKLKKAVKRKSSTSDPVQKKLKLNDESDESGDTDEDEEINAAMKEYLGEDTDEDSDEDDEEEEEDEDMEESSEEDEEMTPEKSKVKNSLKSDSKSQRTPLLEKKMAKMASGDQSMKQTPSTDKKLKQTPSANKNVKQTPSADKNMKQTPSAQKKLTQTPSTQKKGNKTQQDENKNLNASQNGEPQSGETESAKKKKKKKKKKKNPATEETEQQTPDEKQAAKKRVLQGGTLMEELKIGHGPEAKEGKMVHVYYAGKLSSNGKQFDSKLEGQPFKFRLGKREVIQGWDAGVVGMKVGGKRRLTVPANQAYGKQRQGPIPPNSTLVFEIELKAVS